MGKMKDFDVISKFDEIDAPAVDPVVDSAVEPVAEEAVKPVEEIVVTSEVVAAPIVEITATKPAVISVGGNEEERVVVAGQLRGTIVTQDGTQYLFTGNGVCAIFRKHLEELRLRGCSEL